jgi:hypothetical protein
VAELYSEEDTKLKNSFAEYFEDKIKIENAKFELKNIRSNIEAFI